MAEDDSDRSEPRKDRLVQTRVPRGLESTLKREARRRRLTVSHLIRNVLEDAFQLVDDVVANVDEIVSDSVELARRVKRDARRVAEAVRDVGDVGDDPPWSPSHEETQGERSVPDSLAHVYGWNRVVSNRAGACARCGSEIERGAEAYAGLSDDPKRPRAWLCAACGEALG